MRCDLVLGTRVDRILRTDRQREECARDLQPSSGAVVAPGALRGARALVTRSLDVRRRNSETRSPSRPFAGMRFRDVGEQAAQRAIEQHGADAARVLRERAEIAAELGDNESAETWREVADAAERLLGDGADQPA